jgi:hypothetical protein
MIMAIKYGPKDCNTPERQAGRILPIVWVCLAVTFAVSPLEQACGRPVTPPRVPTEIQLPQGNVPFLEGHAKGTQNYICLPSATGFKFVLLTPEATLFDGLHKQVMTHFFSPNPSEDGKIRPTWQHSTDSSIVWGGTATPSSDPKFVAKDALAWLKLPMAGVQVGPTGGGRLTATTFIQRVNTSGGVAPSEGCSSIDDVGKQAFVPYEADYVFYTDRLKRHASR